jgi:hypothetical protein
MEFGMARKPGAAPLHGQILLVILVHLASEAA